MRTEMGSMFEVGGASGMVTDNLESEVGDGL